MSTPELIKPNTQGNELEISKGFNHDQLNRILLIEIEVEFLELYKNQKLSWEINK